MQFFRSIVMSNQKLFKTYQALHWPLFPKQFELGLLIQRFLIAEGLREKVVEFLSINGVWNLKSILKRAYVDYSLYFRLSKFNRFNKITVKDVFVLVCLFHENGQIRTKTFLNLSHSLPKNHLILVVLFRIFFHRRHCIETKWAL